MTCKPLVHNLKLLGFDETKHAGDGVQLNELLFSRDAVNNDKAFEYICIFLFRRIDKNRVKRDLAPNLANRTYGAKLKFIAKVYRWLYEIGRGCDLFRKIPLRKSELLTCHGNNIIKIMTAFSTFVLEHTIESNNNNDVLVSAKSSLAAIQKYITRAHQSFNLIQESNNTFTSKASEAATKVNVELSSPPPQSATTEETRRLNQDLGVIRLECESMQNAEPDNTPTSTTHSPQMHQGSNSQEGSFIFMPITPTYDPAKISNSSNSEITNSSESNSSHSSSVNNNKPVPLDSKFVSIPSIATITHCIPHYSALDTSYRSSRSIASNDTTRIPFLTEFINNTLPSLSNLEHSTYVKEPCRLPSFRNHFLENASTPAVESPYWFLPPIYHYNPANEFDINSMLLTQHFSPAPVKATPPPTLPLAETPPRKRKYSTFEESSEEDVTLPSPARRKIIHQEEIKTPPAPAPAPSPSPAPAPSPAPTLAPSPSRSPSPSPAPTLALRPSPAAAPSPHYINLELEDHYESSLQNLDDLEAVPQLMEESAPFTRIYQTEYFDIDFFTPTR